MRFSTFADRFQSDAGILRLMDDLGSATAGGRKVIMLGGGNPGRIPAVQARFRARMDAMLRNGDEYDRVVGDYDGPQGHAHFIEALASLLRREFGWDIRPENVAVTNGSQAAFFVIMNLFSGQFHDGVRRRVLLPLTPEYIGYGDLGLDPPTFESRQPTIERLGRTSFKYHVNFADLPQFGIGAICASRPTNPTGNVLTNAEVEQLLQIAEARDVPLIIDGAYGTPFPNIIFTDAEPVWNERIVLCLSLSKLGLPGARTGIVIARPDLIKLLASANAIMNLATGSIGPALALDMVRSGEIVTLSRDVIRPFYRERAAQAVAWINDALKGYPFAAHKTEGSMFLWLWFRDLPVSSEVLYQRLKTKGVVVVSGHHFFPGLEDDWRHRHECLRVSFAGDPARLRDGLRIIAEEVRAAYGQIADSA